VSRVPARQVLHGAAARSALLAGVDAVADAVRVTLGPAGRTVLVRRSRILMTNISPLPAAISSTIFRCGSRRTRS